MHGTGKLLGRKDNGASYTRAQAHTHARTHARTHSDSGGALHAAASRTAAHHTGAGHTMGCEDAVGAMDLFSAPRTAHAADDYQLGRPQP